MLTRSRRREKIRRPEFDAMLLSPIQDALLAVRRNQSASAALVLRLPIPARSRQTDARCGGQVLEAAELQGDGRCRLQVDFAHNPILAKVAIFVNRELLLKCGIRNM
jgi:hypothetical protein